MKVAVEVKLNVVDARILYVEALNAALEEAQDDLHIAKVDWNQLSQQTVPPGLAVDSPEWIAAVGQRVEAINAQSRAEARVEKLEAEIRHQVGEYGVRNLA